MPRQGGIGGIVAGAERKKSRSHGPLRLLIKFPSPEENDKAKEIRTETHGKKFGQVRVRF